AFLERTAGVNSASGAPAASEYPLTSSATRSSHVLTLSPLLSCHCRYACLSFATLSEGDPMPATSKIGRSCRQRAPRARVAAILSHARRTRARGAGVTWLRARPHPP